MSGPFDFIDRSRVARVFQFATNRDRCIFLGKSSYDQIRWLKDNPEKWRRIKHIPERETVPQSPALPADSETKVRPAEPNAPTSSSGIREDSIVELDVALGDSQNGHCCPPAEPMSLPAPAMARVQGTEIDDPAPRAGAATIDDLNPEATSAKVEPIGNEPNQGCGHQPLKKKRQPGLSRRGTKRSPERQRIFLDGLAEKSKITAACRMADVHPNTGLYWLKRSAAGATGFDLEWRGLVLPFHEHYEVAWQAGRDALEEILWKRAIEGYDKPLAYRGRAMYKIDPVLEARGLRGPDAYLRDEAGNPIPETIRKRDKKSLKLLLRKRLPEIYGNHRKK